MENLAHVYELDRESVLAPRPRGLEETGLGRDFLAELLLKHLNNAGVLDLRQLGERTALAGPIVQDVMDFLRAEACIEVRGAQGAGPRYALTDRGRAAALDAFMRGGYAGPAPVPLEQYERISEAQSVRKHVVTREAMQQAFAGTVVRPELLDALGPALHSGRAIFVYGPAGTGKTYISTKLTALLGDAILVPHAISIGDSVVQFYDPVVHKPAGGAAAERSPLLGQGHDPRFLRCKRPVVITGGELTLDMLELAYDPATRLYRAPLQLKANNGTLMIDDLGRQRAATADLLNRWIVPMEERRDYLSLGAGQHFPVPFDVVLMFSTNLNPLELADEAFLRRLGYKVRFDYLTPDQYSAIWRQVCAERGIECAGGVVEHVLEELHARREVPLLPCHPRDLVSLALDRHRYHGRDPVVDVDGIRWAWSNYFVQLDDPQ